MYDATATLIGLTILVATIAAGVWLLGDWLEGDNDDAPEAIEVND